MDVIEGVSIISIGEAKGHGLYVDEQTLMEVKACAESYKGGVKVNLDHGAGIKDIVGFVNNFRIVGKRTKRVDTPAKTNGTAEFGIDVKLPGMVYATVQQCPVIGGKVKSFDAAQAKGMPGVQAVVQISDGVAVVADSWWRAKKAMETVKVEWDEGAVAALSVTGCAPWLAANPQFATDGASNPGGGPATSTSGGWNPNLGLTSHQRGRPAWDEAIAAFVPGPNGPPGLSQ